MRPLGFMRHSPQSNKGFSVQLKQAVSSPGKLRMLNEDCWRYKPSVPPSFLTLASHSLYVFDCARLICCQVESNRDPTFVTQVPHIFLDRCRQRADNRRQR